MTTRAYVQQDFGRFNSVVVYLVQERYIDGVPEVAVLQPTELVMADSDPAAMPVAGLHLPEDFARALLDALALHFGGTGDTRQLRKDYDAERARVDKLIGHLIGRPV